MRSCSGKQPLLLDSAYFLCSLCCAHGKLAVWLRQLVSAAYVLGGHNAQSACHAAIGTLLQSSHASPFSLCMLRWHCKKLEPSIWVPVLLKFAGDDSRMGPGGAHCQLAAPAEHMWVLQTDGGHMLYYILQELSRSKKYHRVWA